MNLQYQQLSPESENDVNNLQQILMAAPGYYLLLEGNLPGFDAALGCLQEFPPGKTIDDKYFYGIKKSGNYIGCFDLVRDYPEPQIAFIGLLLFIEPEQNKSYGVQALQYIKNMAGQWNCNSIRLAVIENNQRALAFWKREGFIELYKKPSEQYSSNAIFMEYALTKVQTRTRCKYARAPVKLGVGVL